MEKIANMFSHSILRTDPHTGLTSTQAQERLKKYGSNGLATATVRWYRVLARQFRSPFIYLLLFAASIAVIFKEYADAGFIFLFVSINSALGFYQEYHSEKTVAMLARLVHPRARVRRDGKEIVIDRREVVPGDIVVIETGDILPADIMILSATGLQVDESVITGESVSVSKRASADESSAAADTLGIGGTRVVGGKAVGIVTATGVHSQLGDISELTTKTVRVSAFEQGIYKFSTFILKLVLSTLLMILLLKLGIQFLYGGTINISELVIFSIALAVSVIPEALPLVTTFSLSRGAAALAKRKVIVRRLSAIEDLGGIQVLCTDKTGTITENALTIADTFIHEKNNIILDASLAAPFLTEETQQPSNSFDMALWEGLTAADKKSALKAVRVAEIPFDPDRRRNSVLVQWEKGGLIIVRGATESVFELCSGLSKHTIKDANTWSKAQGLLGRRVIAVAKRSVTKSQLTSTYSEEKLDFVGLISFVDPLKKSAPQAIADARALGVTVKIITGDSPDVAGAIGTQVGLIHDPSLVITGEAFSALPESEKIQAVGTYHVFARVSPKEKHAIIALLKQHYVVGYLGEGINDAPALKEAHVAITVDGAADVAREAADIVLLQHDLSVVVDGIKKGREVFANTIKYIKATLASNFGNFYAVAFASLLVDFLPMLSVQILLLNLLSDFPMIAIAADSVDEDELKAPRTYDIKEVALIATVLGIVSTFFDFMFFGIFSRFGAPTLQTTWFIGSILTELVFLFSIRTRLVWWRAKPPTLIIIALSAITASIAFLIPYTAVGKDIFHFVHLPPAFLVIILVLVATYFIATEVVKSFYYRFRRSELARVK